MPQALLLSLSCLREHSVYSCHKVFCVSIVICPILLGLNYLVRYTTVLVLSSHKLNSDTFEIVSVYIGKLIGLCWKE